MNIYEQLAKPFPANRVHWRIGARTKDRKKGKPLAYIDARDVMQRLDDVMGPECWQDEYLPPGANGLVICRVGLFVPVCDPETGETQSQWVWKSNGAGETQVEGEKGSCSDAFKRAAVLWGIGRYLYALPNAWVALDQYGKFTPPELPTWATPEGYDEIMKQRKQA